MFLFGAAFFGGLLLVPTYFQQIRGESTLNAGLLVAPQGIGAMLTMPIAEPGRQVPGRPDRPGGRALIITGMFGFTQITSTSSYTMLIGLLFVMGLGMGATMMPIMTSALKTLSRHEVARGSTLLNIVQQIASSIGVAIMSVLLTNHLKDSTLAMPAIGSWRDPALIDKIGGRQQAPGPGRGGVRLRQHLLGGGVHGGLHPGARVLPAAQAPAGTADVRRRRRPPADHGALTPLSSHQAHCRAAARPAVRPENRQPPRKVPSSAL